MVVPILGSIRAILSSRYAYPQLSFTFGNKRFFPYNIPRHLLAPLLSCYRSTGFLDHLPGRVVQYHGPHVPVSEQLLMFTVGLQLVPKMYHSGYNVKSNLEDWFGVAGRYTNLLYVLLHPRNSLEYTSSLRVRLITSSKFPHSVLYM